MLKFTEASESRDRVAEADKSLRQAQDELVQLCNQLYALRSDAGRALVADFEHYVNTLASKPKTYDRSLELYHVNLRQFDKAGKSFSDSLGDDIRDAAAAGGATIGLGSATGVATAFAAPTAAMAIATTFGTASTGTAISALSGAAATNAALAWLGGGALAAGGGGVAAGNALLALAGPVGLALAGTSLVAGLGWAAYKNRSTIEEATAMHQQLKKAHANVQQSSDQVSGLYGLTVEHTHNLRQLMDSFAADAPRDYLLFSDRQKELLGAMHNNVLALGRLLKLRPGEVADLTAPVDDAELTSAQESEPKAAYKPNFVVSGEPTTSASAKSATAFLSRFVGEGA